MLATKWTPSKGGAVWTFTLRPNVKFHDGSPMTADDVVYTFQQLSDPKNASNALSTFTGVLKPEGVVKVDSATVAFHLEAPNGNFPYLVSSDNYNAIIVPKGTDFGKWQKTFIGTGPFKLQSYTTNVGANFVANPDYWGGAPNLESTAFTFYTSQQPQILALQGGQVDVIVQFVVQGAQALLEQRAPTTSSSSSRPTTASCRCATTRRRSPTRASARRSRCRLDRPGMVQALLQGYGVVGNDSPFSPKFPSTRHERPAAHPGHHQGQAAAPGRRTRRRLHHPRWPPSSTRRSRSWPQVIAEAASKIGVNINLKVENQASYYGKATFGNSDWLDATMSLVDYGDRGVPNVFLNAPLLSDGTVERRALQEPHLRQPGQAVRRRRSICRPRGRSRARSRRCCSMRRR